jgi:uncharacterized protein (UPF0333 family)
MFASRHHFGVSHAIGLVVGLLALSGAVVYYVMRDKNTRAVVRKVEGTATRVMRKARHAAKSNHASTHAHA